MRHAIIWTNADPILCHMFAGKGVDELKSVFEVLAVYGQGHALTDDVDRSTLANTDGKLHFWSLHQMAHDVMMISLIRQKF